MNAHWLRFYLIGLLGYSCLVVADTGVKQLSENGYSTLILMIAEAIGGITIFGLYAYFKKLPSPFKLSSLGFHSFRGWVAATGLVTAIYGFTYLPLAEAYAIVFLSPFVTTALSALIFKEQVGWHRWMAIIVGFAGVLIVMFPELIGLPSLQEQVSNADPSQTPYAIAAMVISALCFTTMMLVMKRTPKDVSALSLAVSPYLVAKIPLILLGLIIMQLGLSDHSGISLKAPEISSMPYFLMYGLFANFGGLALIIAFSNAPASLISPLHYSVLITGSLSGYLFFGDVPNMSTVIGGVVIIAAGLYMIRREFVHQRKQQQS